MLPSKEFKYEVVFYGTLQTSICAANKIKHYNDDTRKQLNKNNKKRKMSDLYKKSVMQIERAMKEELSSVSLVPNKLAVLKRKVPARNQERLCRAELVLNQENERPNAYCYRKVTRKVSAAASTPVIKGKLGAGISRKKIAAQMSPKASNNTVVSSTGVSSQSLSALRILGVSSQSNVSITHVAEVNIRDQQTTRVLLAEHVAATLDSLSMNDPKPDDAIMLLKYIEKDMLEMVQKSMLLRSPEVLPSMIQLSKYIGNVGEWNLNDLQLEVFNRKTTEIREIAGKIARRFKVILLYRLTN